MKLICVCFLGAGYYIRALFVWLLCSIIIIKITTGLQRSTHSDDCFAEIRHISYFLAHVPEDQ